MTAGITTIQTEFDTRRMWGGIEPFLYIFLSYAYKITAAYSIQRKVYPFYCRLSIWINTSRIEDTTKDLVVIHDA